MRRQSTDRYFRFTAWLGAFIDARRLAFRMRLYRAQCYFLCQLGVLKFVFSILRRVRPVFIFNKLLVVTQAREVREVLDRFDDFTLGESIEPGMPWGNFLMTVDWRQRHKEERAWLQSVVYKADADKIRAIVVGRCQQQIAAANGRLDVVSQLLEPVVVGIANEYFGVPSLAGSTQQMAHAMRDLAGIIMVKPPIGSEPWSHARASIAGITDLVRTEISSAVSNPAGQVPDTLLTRLVGRLGAPAAPAWFDQDWIRRYMTGLIATGGATIVRAAAGAIDQILEHPDAMRQAQAVARELDQAMASGNQAQVDMLCVKLQHFVYEALRFRPMLPLLVRDTPRETVIAYGTKKARVVRAGTRVLAPPMSAMFDEAAVPDPSRFNPSRSFDQYLHFGFGLRECFGRYIAEIALLEVFRSLLLLNGLARAKDPKGQLRFDGPVAAGLFITF